MVTVNFLIDGFNLYHSTREAERRHRAPTKWLDLKKMLYGYHPIYSAVANDKLSLGDIYYFSAYAYHRLSIDPYVVSRHEKLVRCLQDTGIHTIMNKFKPKDARCPSCLHQWIKHEEKETDVAIAVKLIELFVTEACEMVVIVSGDTDIAPAVKTAKKLFPQKKVIFAFPAYRKNKILLSIAPGSFKIKPRAYTQNQFPDPYTCSDGRTIQKPVSW